MPIRLADLAARLSAALSGDGERSIEGVASLADAGPAHIAPFTDPRFQAQLERTRAGAVIVHADFEAAVPTGAALLRAADPEMVFIAAARLLHPETQERPGVDPRAVIEAGALLDKDVYVGPGAVVRSGARIGARSWVLAHAVVGRDCALGEDCRLYPHVVLYDGVRLGSRVVVHAGSVLGADGFGYKFRDGRHVKVPQVGGLEIGDDVEIGANACIDRGALSPTRIGSGTKIDNLVQIGHGVSIGKHCILCGQAAIAGSSGMDDYAVLGGNAGIADHVFMGKGSKAGAKSGVGRDVPPGQEVFGNFAEERKIAFKQLAALRRLPELAERVRALEQEIKKKQSEPRA